MAARRGRGRPRENVFIKALLLDLRIQERWTDARTAKHAAMVCRLFRQEMEKTDRTGTGHLPSASPPAMRLLADLFHLTFGGPNVTGDTGITANTVRHWRRQRARRSTPLKK
jgi:hypothetical protein